ncbi:hypothetical protein T10_10950 [Trichinella papuae]|uniref:Uncharacterized protein n=1 Tax=Trichinella papuae TaxID=268474 RepID=A0A0V1MTM6_9BILA|nr:hypothetical protein T10_10950 [Trichinella papuae]
MNTDYQLWEIADLSSDSPQLSISKTDCCSTKINLRYKCYYNQRLLLAGIRKLIKCDSRVYYQGGRFYVALNCSHYNRIMIKLFDKFAQSCAIFLSFAQLIFPSFFVQFD